MRGPSEDEEPPPRGIPGGGETAPPPPGMGASGSWDAGGRIPEVLPLLFSREHGPPNLRQAPALAAPTFSFPALQVHSQPPPPLPPARIHSPLRPRPSAARRALASTRANHHRVSPAPAPIRARWRRGFSNVIEAPPGAPRSLLFGKRQTGIEVASLPAGSVSPLLPELGAGWLLSRPAPATFHFRCGFLGRTRASASCFTLLVLEAQEWRVP